MSIGIVGSNEATQINQTQGINVPIKIENRVLPSVPEQQNPENNEDIIGVDKIKSAVGLINSERIQSPEDKNTASAVENRLNKLLSQYLVYASRITKDIHNIPGSLAMGKLVEYSTRSLNGVEQKNSVENVNIANETIAKPEEKESIRIIETWCDPGAVVKGE